MFDPIIAEADERFDLNGKAGTLLSALLAVMTNGTSGDLTGFLEKFRTANLSRVASTWISSGVNSEISNEQLESALGADTLTGISNQIGTEYETTVSAAAFIIPRVINALTPGGVLPEDGDLLSRIGGTLNGVEETGIAATKTFDRVGTAAAPILKTDTKDADDMNTIDRNVNPVADEAADSVNSVDDTSNDKNNSPLGWLLPLLLLGLLLVLGYWFCSKSPENTALVTTNVNDNTIVTNINLNTANQ